jgi:hypothetical protein
LLGSWVQILLRARMFVSCVCCLFHRHLWWTDHLFGGDQLHARLIVCNLGTSTMRWCRPKLGCFTTENKVKQIRKEVHLNWAVKYCDQLINFMEHSSAWETDRCSSGQEISCLYGAWICITKEPATGLYC